MKGAPLDIRVLISLVSPLLEASSNLFPRSTSDRGTVDSPDALVTVDDARITTTRKYS